MRWWHGPPPCVRVSCQNQPIEQMHRLYAEKSPPNILLHPSYESGLGNTVNLLIEMSDYPPFWRI